MIRKNLNLTFAIIFYVFLNNIAVASDCLNFNADQYSFCSAYEKIKNLDELDFDKSVAECNQLKNDQIAYSTCLALSDLASGGNCLSIHGKYSDINFLVCNEIYIGYLGNDCKIGSVVPGYIEDSKEIDRIISIDSQKTFCRFGKFLAEDQNFKDTREIALLAAMLEPQIEDAFGRISEFTNKLNKPFIPILTTKWSSSISRKITSDVMEKIKDKTRLLSARIFRSVKKYSQYKIDHQEFVDYITKLIVIIEGYRQSFLEDKKSDVSVLYQLNYEQPDYYPPVGPDVHQLFGNIIQITPDGRIIFHMGRATIGKVKLNPIGSGKFKDVLFSFDYDKAVDKRRFGIRDYGFLATGFLRDTQGANQSRELRTDARLEIELQKLLKDKVGIAIADSFYDQNIAFTLQKYYRTDLFDLIVSWGKLRKSPQQWNAAQIDRSRVNLAIDLLDGLANIHSEGLHHRDIKPENILVDYDASGKLRAYISDFGFAYDTTGRAQFRRVSRPSGSKHYVSPTFLREIAYKFNKLEHEQNVIKVNNDYRNDIWSMGLVLHALYTLQGNQIDASDESDAKLFAKIRSVDSYEKLKSVYGIWNQTGNPFEEVILNMLNPDPDKRITARQARDEVIKIRDLMYPDSTLGFSFNPTEKIEFEDISSHVSVSWNVQDLRQNLEDKRNHEIKVMKETNFF